MKDKNLYLIDATAFCYRAFYALPGLATSFGQPTNAIYGFLNIMNKILKSKKPDYLAVCFDVSRDTFRMKKFAQYKIQRPPMPEGLVSQLPFIKQIISAYGIKIFEKEGFEADDVIATLNEQAKKSGLSVTIVSSDKDMLQLVDEHTLVLAPHKNEEVVYDRKKVVERFGVDPAKISDLIALMGDSVDNIPGAAGIGEKTATDLIARFGSLDKLLNNIDKIKQEKLRGIISGNIDRIKLSKELAILDKNIEIEFNPDDLKPAAPDLQELVKLFKYLEFKKLLRELPAAEEKNRHPAAENIEGRRFAELAGEEKELFIFGDSREKLIFCLKEKFLRILSFGKEAAKILADPKIKKIGHDLKKTKVLLSKEGIMLEGLFFDTMIAAYLLNPSRGGYTLSELALEYLGEVVSETPAEEQCLDLIRRLKPILEKQLQEKSLFKLFSSLEMPLERVLAEMELNGIRLDAEVLKKLSRDVEKRLIKLIEGIYGLSGTQFNINSPKQLREILFEKLKLPVIRKNKTGPSTDEGVLKALADKHELPAMLVEYRQLTKLKNTYIDTLPQLADKKTGRIHTSFNQTVTETGRLSSSNPNLQNIPLKSDIGKNIRRAIIASDDKSYLLSCDYSQIELRILAHLSEDEDLIASFKQDKDIHRHCASLIYGVEEKEVSGSMRDTAKRVNFGIIYGLSAFGLSRDLNIAMDESQQFIDAYFARYPRVKDYIEQQIAKAKKDGFVTTLLGRRRYIPEIQNKNQGIRQFAERQAVNTPIQGSASDLIKLAMVEINELLTAAELKTKMILQIHDELVFDCPAGELRQAAMLVKESMENVMQLKVPVRVDIKRGRNWLETEPIQ
ncbi:MAG: DNA polymerase I [Candidatus Omnitrophica bacterium]|nr:DNA polymerase I [Candidatus Omnitrophota bacterium]MBL7210401.1 DNA polymerase I [Candidatus Omnitrophota bacterium]